METSPLSCRLSPSEPKRALSYSSIFKPALIPGLQAGHGHMVNPDLMASSPPPQPLPQQNRTDHTGGGALRLSSLQWIPTAEGLQFPNANSHLLSQNE